MTHKASKIRVHPLIEERWSPRAFSPEPIPEEELLTVLEAGRLAPSSFNLQPWRFIYAEKEDEDAFARLFDTLMDANKAWAGNVPLLILSVAERVNPITGEENPYAVHDVGLAVMSMVIQAEALGLKAHQMSGFYADQARTALGIPDGFDPVSVTAFGRPGDPEDLPEGLYENELKASGREPLERSFFKGDFGTPGYNR